MSIQTAIPYANNASAGAYTYSFEQEVVIVRDDGIVTASTHLGFVPYDYHIQILLEGAPIYCEL